MDFVHDVLAGGRRIRCLNVVDDFTRESVIIEVDTSISGARVARVLDRVAEIRPLPKMIRVDHGPEFTSLAMDAWGMPGASSLHLPSLGSQLRMRTLRASTAGFGTNASTTSGSQPCMKHAF
jgi:putative transposase